MDFSKAKLLTLKPKKEKYFSTFLLGLLVSAAFFLPYMLLSEGYFIFYGDFNVQQIPFYQECHQAIREGNVFWNWNTDLGANFIGSYSFYLLGSPFFWITLLFPTNFVPYLMGPLLILKFGCASLTAYCYIRRFTRSPEAARLGGLLYAFSGFSVYNIFFNHFHEAIILFPLLLLSLELLITENRRFFFAFMVFACAVVNYFFFFGMVVFCVIYFFVRLFSGAFSVKPARFISLVFEAVLGLLLSAALLIPAVMAITGNYRVSQILLGWNAIMYGKEQIYANVLQCFFFPPDIPARPVFFPSANVKWSSLGGWLPVFSMAGVLTLFRHRRGSWQKRLIGICIFMSMVPILNSAFYAFNTAYYARWFYMPILIMCLATVGICEDTECDWNYGFKWTIGITLAVTAVIGFFPQENDDGKLIFGLYSQGNGGSEDRLMYAFRFFTACAIALVGLALLGLLIKYIKTNQKTFFTAATACVCILSIIYGNVFIASGRSHSYDIKEVVIDQLIEGEVDLQDNSEFRVDVYDGIDNTSMFLGLRGINAFHSIVPASVYEFYDYIGIKRTVATRPDTEIEALRPLLSVKYLLNRKDGEDFVDTETKKAEMSGYSYYKSDGGYYIYQNDNYVPYGFSYDYYMSHEFCDGYNEETRANLMLKAILLDDEQIKKYGHLFEDLSTLPNSTYVTPEQVSLSVSDNAMTYDCARLRETSAEEFTTDNRGFTAKVKREKATLVFFSVPYDKGWSATVNGKEVQIEKVNAGFMAVYVPAGESEIRFDYMTPGLNIGIVITTLSAVIFLIYIIAFSAYNHKHKTPSDYPEGKKLLAEWRSQEIAIETETRNAVKPSILDGADTDFIPQADNELSGGFKIDTDLFNDDN